MDNIYLIFIRFKREFEAFSQSFLRKMNALNLIKNQDCLNFLENVKLYFKMYKACILKCSGTETGLS